MKRLALLGLLSLLFTDIAHAASIVSIATTALPDNHNTRLIFITVDLSGTRPTQLNLYVDGHLSVQHLVQGNKPTDWLVWQPSPSDYGLERLLRIEALNGSTLINNDAKPVYVWPSTTTGMQRIDIITLNGVKYVNVTRSLPGLAVPTTLQLYVDNIPVASIQDTLGQSVTMFWKPTINDLGKQHIIRVDVSVPLLGTSSDTQYISLW